MLWLWSTQKELSLQHKSAPSQTLSKASTHPVPRPVCTLEGCKVSVKGNQAFDELHWLCQLTGQRPGEPGKIKLAAIDPLRIATAETGYGCTLEPWASSVVQSPSKHSSLHGNAAHTASCSALLRLCYWEVYPVAPLELQKHICILEPGWWC